MARPVKPLRARLLALLAAIPILLGLPGGDFEKSLDGVSDPYVAFGYQSARAIARRRTWTIVPNPVRRPRFMSGPKFSRLSFPSNLL
jgi:hypothetical protein